MKTKTYINIVLSALVGLAVETAGMDLNGDGVINADDSKKFLELITSGGTIDPALDLNDDSKVDLHDALLYGQWVNGLYHSSTCPDLFMNNPEDTAAFSNYAKTVVQTKKTFTKTNLLNAYPDNTNKNNLGYQASNVAGLSNFLDMVSISDSARTALTNQVLSKGVVISNLQFPNFLTALDAIHNKDMPLIFTTDALLYSMYRSYDNILMTLETNRFNAMLDSILKSSLDYCNKCYGSEDYSKDIKNYLSTALFLLNLNRTDITKSSQVESNLNNIQSEQMTSVQLYDSTIMIDFSQFKPRGHYDNSDLLKRYFKAMMWLSRADLSFPIAGTNASARMKKASLVLWDCVVNSGTYPRWLEFNSVIELMVGTSDGMSVRGVGSLVKDLGIPNVKDYLSAFNESKFDSVVNKNNSGIQMILSQYKEYNKPTDSLDLAKIVSFMPQRFILDSYTFSQIVYPLLVDYRELPSSLDIAFTLGDNSALRDHTELDIRGLPGVLSCQRKLYDQLSVSGYQANLYTSWINSLRQLNGAENNTKISPVFRTAAWRIKMRNTQLMSWAHLRHNTILYAKQSYTGTVICSYPKAYIEPYPAFFQAIADYAAKGKKFFTTYDQSVASYFNNLEQTSKKLKTAAEYCASGQPFSTDLEVWLKGCLTSTSSSSGCTRVKIFDGWYKDLFYVSNISTSNESNRLDGESSLFSTIADVHTKPADEMGPAKVLHAATGNVNLMAVIVEADTCPMVFVGPVGSYYDVITSDPSTPKRLTDDDWKSMIRNSTTTVSRPPWMGQVLYK